MTVDNAYSLFQHFTYYCLQRQILYRGYCLQQWFVKLMLFSLATIFYIVDIIFNKDFANRKLSFAVVCKINIIVFNNFFAHFRFYLSEQFVKLPLQSFATILQTVVIVSSDGLQSIVIVSSGGANRYYCLQCRIFTSLLLSLAAIM